MTTVVDEKMEIFRKKEQDYQNLTSKKAASLSQFNENSLVKSELEMLGDDENVFKLVGPILIPIELDDAKDNITKRMEFIESDIKRIEEQIDGSSKELAELRDDIGKAQQELRANATQAAQAVAQQQIEES